MYALRFTEHRQNLRCHMHMPTVHVNSKIIYEKLYPLGFAIEAKIREIQSATLKEIEAIRANIKRSVYPNTYTFTKAMAEHLAAAHAAKTSIPLVIFRPTIVGCAWKDPVPGWVDQIAGVGAVSVAMSLGVVTLLPLKVDNVFDVVFVPQWPQSEPLIVHCGTSDPRQSPLNVHVPGTECTNYYVKNRPSCAAPPRKASHGARQVGMPGVEHHWPLPPITDNDWVFRTDASLDDDKQLGGSDKSDTWWTSTRGIAWSEFIVIYCKELQILIDRKQSSSSKKS